MLSASWSALWLQGGGQQQHLPCHSQHGEVGCSHEQEKAFPEPPVMHCLGCVRTGQNWYLPVLESVTGKEGIDFQTFLTMTHSQKHVSPKISRSRSHTHVYAHVHACGWKQSFTAATRVSLQSTQLHGKGQQMCHARLQSHFRHRLHMLDGALK